LSKSAIFAREVFLDQIFGVGKDYKCFVNRQFPGWTRKKSFAFIPQVGAAAH
jgi:hypothetical protein